MESLLNIGSNTIYDFETKKLIHRYWKHSSLSSSLQIDYGEKTMTTTIEVSIMADELLYSLLGFASITHFENAVLIPFVPVSRERAVDVGLALFNA